MTGPRVVLLGTGAAANERRNQACLLVERADPALPPILLDTGNGLGVVRALLAADIDPLRIQDAFISHRHPDHAGGLDPLLLWRRLRVTAAGRPAPEAGLRVLTEARTIAALHRAFDADASNTMTVLGEGLQWLPLRDGEPVPLLGGGLLVPFLVDHAPVDGGALGCIVEVDGFKIAYSGDTRPSTRLIEAVHGADLLIHEAGGLDRDADRVRTHFHSTAGDAARAARDAGVGHLVLTHLNNAPTVDRLHAEAQSIFAGPVTLATDGGIIQL